MEEEGEESDHASPPAIKREVRLYSQISIGDAVTPGPVTVASVDAACCRSYTQIINKGDKTVSSDRGFNLGSVDIWG